MKINIRGICPFCGEPQFETVDINKLDPKFELTLICELCLKRNIKITVQQNKHMGDQHET